MLLVYDFGKKLKIAQWLIKKGKDLYLPKILSIDKLTEKNTFYNMVFSCYGADEDCFPQVAILNGIKIWSPSKKIACVIDGKCVFSKTLQYNDE